MPKGPQGQKRPRDVVSNAVKVMRIATGEEEEEYEDDGKNRGRKLRVRPRLSGGLKNSACVFIFLTLRYGKENQHAVEA